MARFVFLAAAHVTTSFPVVFLFYFTARGCRAGRLLRASLVCFLLLVTSGRAKIQKKNTKKNNNKHKRTARLCQVGGALCVQVSLRSKCSIWPPLVLGLQKRTKGKIKAKSNNDDDNSNHSRLEHTATNRSGQVARAR